jgi:threonine dehydrogenase-like Zn-dependent dehydrogenase
MDTKQIAFVDVGVAKLIDAVCEEPAKDRVQIKTLYTTISNGTERANLMGDININASKRPDSTTPVFPRYSGYSESGIVTAVGENVTEFKVGDRVAGSWGVHKGMQTILAQNLVKVPDDVPMNIASLAHIATFPMAAVRKIRPSYGESAIVMGLGILGIFAIEFLKVAGMAPIIAADPNEGRRKLALEMGADYAIDPFDKDFTEKVKELTGGGVNAAIEVTGVGKALDQVLDCMARFGRVALLGCTRDSNFTIDYYRKVHGPGIELIGAHTIARPKLESREHCWTERDDKLAFFKLIKYGRIHPEKIIHEVHSPAEATEVYHRLAYDKDFPFGVQFKWNEEDEK